MYQGVRGARELPLSQHACTVLAGRGANGRNPTAYNTWQVATWGCVTHYYYSIPWERLHEFCNKAECYTLHTPCQTPDLVYANATVFYPVQYPALALQIQMR